VKTALLVIAVLHTPLRKFPCPYFSVGARVPGIEVEAPEDNCS